MPNLYADVGHFRKAIVGSSTLGTDDLAAILRALETASRQIDGFVDRHFYSLTATRYFDGNGRQMLFIPDLLHDSSTTVKLDEDTDGTYELTLSDPDDYWPIHYGADDIDSDPTTAIRLNRYQGQRAIFMSLPRLMQIAGIWGYTDAVERVVGSTVDDNPLTADATTLNVTADTGDELYEEGQTLLLESEQVYLSAIDNDALAIVRGINGTTAAAHVKTTVIDRYVYVPEIRDATLIQAARLWERRKTAYATDIQETATGVIPVYKGLDWDARMLVAPYRRVGF